MTVSVVYPLLDSTGLMTAVLITGYPLGIMSRLSILLFAIAMVLFAVGNTGFSYFALTEFTALQDKKVWNVLYAVLYVSFAGSLLTVLLETCSGSKRIAEIQNEVKKYR